MSLVLVLGATGNQGSAVVDALERLGHDIRAMVRDTEGEASARLRERGIATVVGDFDDLDSLTEAARGTDAMFAMTTPAAGTDAEIRQGRNLADAALAAGTGHLVYSSVASADRSTGIPHFDSKAEVERYIRGLALPWSIVGPVWFMENLAFPWNLEDYADGRLRLALRRDRTLQMISSANIGRFCAYVIDRREPFVGERIDIAADQHVGPAIADALGAAMGRTLAYEELPLAEEAVRFEDSATMYEWIGRVGFAVDIAALHADHPDVDWIDLASWARTQTWAP